MVCRISGVAPNPLPYGAERRGVKAAIGPVLAVLAAFIAFSPGAAKAETQLLVLGDSLTAGYGLPKEDAFPAQLQKALDAAGHEVVVVDAGVSGDTTAGGRSRLGWALSEDIDAVIVELGGNDGLRGIDPSETGANIDAILAELKERELPALLAGMLAPPNLGRDYGDAFNAVFATAAVKHGAVFYPFFLDGVAADPSLNQSDGIHPNAEGVAIVVERILPYVETLLERTE